MQSARLRLLANALAIAASRKRSQHKSQANLGLANSPHRLLRLAHDGHLFAVNAISIRDGLVFAALLDEQNVQQRPRIALCRNLHQYF